MTETKAGHTAGEWRVSGDGERDRLWVNGKDYPVAHVTCGEWGDSKPSIRITEDDTAEAYIAFLAYGEVPTATALANAKLIAASPDMADTLTDVLEFLDDQADVRDGNDGRQLPNRAMSLAQDVRAVLWKAGREV